MLGLVQPGPVQRLGALAGRVTNAARSSPSKSGGPSANHMPTAPIARSDSGSGTASGVDVHCGSRVRTARASGWSSVAAAGSAPHVP